MDVTEWDIPELRNLLKNLLVEEKTFENFIIEEDFHLVGQKKACFDARKLIKPADRNPMILLALEDITGNKRLHFLPPITTELLSNHFFCGYLSDLPL